MEYLGKLYGKIGNKYFDTGVSAKDFDNIKKQNNEMLEMLKECMRVLSSVQSPATPSILLYREIEKLIKQTTEI